MDDESGQATEEDDVIGAETGESEAERLGSG